MTVTQDHISRVYPKDNGPSLAFAFFAAAFFIELFFDRLHSKFTVKLTKIKGFAIVINVVVIAVDLVFVLLLVFCVYCPSIRSRLEIVILISTSMPERVPISRLLPLGGLTSMCAWQHGCP